MDAPRKPMLPLGTRARSALVQVGEYLRQERYRFVAVTPATHARVVAKRKGQLARDMRDVFGWNMAFRPEVIPPAILLLLEAAGCLGNEGPLLKSNVRFATLDGFVFAHSGYPTLDAESVFFGPDTYRFVEFVRRALAGVPLAPTARLIDIGTGSGACGLVCAARSGILRPVLADISAVALSFAQANAQLMRIDGCQMEFGDLFGRAEGQFDLIVCNPPYMKDPLARVYRDGGDNFGAQLSERILRESLPRLARGGKLLLYTGVAVVDGADVFRPVVESALAEMRWPYEYREIDPDVFGEEISQPDYFGVERIAAVGLVVTRP